MSLSIAKNNGIEIQRNVSTKGRGRVKRFSRVALLAGAVLVSGALQAGQSVATAPEATGSQSGRATGPTLRLGNNSQEAAWNPMTTFMYFVPLISPEPVSPVSTPGSTQAVRVTSAQRRSEGNKFTVTCDFEFAGSGVQKNLIDLSRQIRRHEGQLKAGAPLERQLKSISVAGQGKGSVEVVGTVKNGVQTVNEVRLRFNGHGEPSPVSINLCDIHYSNADYKVANEIVAKVNSLTFRRQAGTPKMEVDIASVKNKDAGNGWWQNFKGRVKGAAANMLIDPLAVETIGYRTMLDFGQALANHAPTFTFPRAKNVHIGEGLLGQAY